MSERVVGAGRVERDALPACVVAATSVVVFALFVALPVRGGSPVPASLEVLWTAGFPAGVFLAPVAAGLAAFVSARALVSRGRTGPGRTRALHGVTIALAAALLVAYVASADGLRALLD